MNSSDEFHAAHSIAQVYLRQLHQMTFCFVIRSVAFFPILVMSILRVLNVRKLIICFDRNQNRLNVRHNLPRELMDAARTIFVGVENSKWIVSLVFVSFCRYFFFASHFVCDLFLPSLYSSSSLLHPIVCSIGSVCRSANASLKSSLIYIYCLFKLSTIWLCVLFSTVLSAVRFMHWQKRCIGSIYVIFDVIYLKWFAIFVYHLKNAFWITKGSASKLAH